MLYSQKYSNTNVILTKVPFKMLSDAEVAIVPADIIQEVNSAS